VPLIHSKSKKSVGKNIKTEMEHGKPHKQAIAIALSVKAKPKRMAKGGSISASNEKRPMPNDRHDDSMQVSENSSKKPANNDKWTDKPTEKQAMANDVRGKKLPIKRPRMVPSDAFSARLYDKEGMLEESASPGPYGEQPSKDMDEMDAKKMGRSPDMAEEHSTHRKPYAKGGEVESMDYDHKANKYEDDLLDLPPSHDEGSEMAMSHDEMDADMEGKSPDMSKPHNMEQSKAYARGGEVSPKDEMDEEHHNSLAAAIRARRDRLQAEIDSGAHDIDSAVRMAEGGEIMEESPEILSHGSMDSDDSDQADL
jgi:hypothetical protein